MERSQALMELNMRIESKYLIKHSLAVEAIMRELASYFGEDENKWGLVGLLHNIDYDKTASELEKRGLVGADILETLGLDDEIVYAVKAHNEYHGIKRKRKIDKVLFAADPIAKLITDAALICPSKKLADVSVDFIMERFNERDFAPEADREQIIRCSEFGMALGQFADISLKALQKIAGELGL